MRSPLLIAAALILLSCGARTPPSSAAATTAEPAAILDKEKCERARVERGRVDVLLADGKLHRSAKLLEHAAELCPTDAREGYAARMQILVDLHDWKGVRALATAIEADADAPEAAKEAARAGRAADAAEIEATKGFVDTPESKQPMRDAYRAAAALEPTEPEKAKAAFLEAWNLWRPNGQALVQAGLIAQRLGQKADAQRLFDRAIVELEEKHQTQVAVDATAGYFAGITDLQWSPRHIGVLDGGVVRLLSPSSRSEIMRLGVKVDAFCISAAGETVVTLENRQIVVWDTALGNERQRISAPSARPSFYGPVFACSASADVIVAGTSVITPRDARVLEYATDGSPTAAAVFPGGDRFVTAERGQITVWNAETGKSIRTFPSGLTPESDMPGALPIDRAVRDLSVDADGTTIAAAGHGGVRVLSPEGRALRHPSDSSDATRVRFAPNGKSIAYAEGNSLSLWSLGSSEKPKGGTFWSMAQGRDKDRASVAFDPARGFLAFSLESRIALVDVLNLEWKVTLGSDPRTIRSSLFSSDGRRLLLDAAPPRVVPLDDDTIATVECESTGSDPIGFTRDGSRLLCGDRTKFELVTLATGERESIDLPTSVCGGDEATYARAMLAADDEQLVFDCGVFKVLEPTTVSLVSLNLETRATTVLGETLDWLTALATSPDRDTVATDCYEGGEALCLWSLAGKPRVVLRGHSKGIADLAFTRDGSRLVSGSEDGTVRLWDATSATAIGVFEANGAVTHVAISPDGKRFAATTVETVLEWTTPLLDGAKPMARDPLVGTLQDVTYANVGSVLVAAGSRGARIWREGSAGALVQKMNGFGDLWITVADDGQIEIEGERTSLEQEVGCRFGAVLLPFAVCRERFETPGLLRAILRGETGDP